MTTFNPMVEVTVPPENCGPIDSIGGRDRLVVEHLPSAWSPLAFARSLVPTARRLRRAIDGSQHLQFAIGGLWGDWGAVSTLLARRAGRSAAVWTDRVESDVTRFHAGRSRGLRRIYWAATAWVMGNYERFIIRRSSMGLFHGMDTYRAYSPFSSAPRLVHNIHLSEKDRISGPELEQKLGQHPKADVRILYAGRVHSEKGVFDWIDALALLRDMGLKFTACWYGDGPDLAEARTQIARHALGDRVTMPGTLSDRDALLRQLREADIFLFCHKTRESPRCLIEALLSGTPIIGYDSPYPADLISRFGGGVLTREDPHALAHAVADAAASSSTLQDLQRNAARDGHDLTAEAVFHHRAMLIKSIEGGRC
ncbi:glycosyltransferase involved in cell wall biosynthesis [Sphingobium subterraneum]|uniref:Glycosyltransferase involved in cell wall biosynthesis n=1 Tax=Sphingobium subterraneum TaxID=627688 RepID=A0A841J238_9SPHN|nr:glycosyltransferase involved in cell wall biosynthesis [Sphingobium subterraneum]